MPTIVNPPRGVAPGPGPGAGGDAAGAGGAPTMVGAAADAGGWPDIVTAGACAMRTAKTLSHWGHRTRRPPAGIFSGSTS
jgi:hypothetical protein